MSKASSSVILYWWVRSSPNSMHASRRRIRLRQPYRCVVGDPSLRQHLDSGYLESGDGLEKWASLSDRPLSIPQDYFRKRASLRELRPKPGLRFGSSMEPQKLATEKIISTVAPFHVP